MRQINRISMIMAVFAFFAFMASCGGGAKSPADVSKSFVEKIEKGDVSAAVKMLDGADKATEEEIQKMEAFLGEGSKEVASKGGIKSIDVLSETISDDGMEADVDLKVIYGNGEEDESTTKLKKIDGNWKISMGK
ncbi:MAG: DUF4878 domain-containing protein [Lentimicrobium sp.]|nr:DUF4878 domain-containing protein [Lentimicrobium sp.]